MRRRRARLLLHRGGATHDQTLTEAGLAEATGLVTCLSGDTDNLFVCLSARDINPKTTIVARAYEEETMDRWCPSRTWPPVRRICRYGWSRRPSGKEEQIAQLRKYAGS